MNISKIYDRLNRMAGEALGTGNPYKGFFQSPGATDVENDRWVEFPAAVPDGQRPLH